MTDVLCTGDVENPRHECAVWWLAGHLVGDDGTRWRAAHAPAPSEPLTCVECGKVPPLHDKWCTVAFPYTHTEKPAPSEPGLRHDIASLRSTAKEQMETGGALASAVFFEGQVYAYDEVLRRLAAPAPSEPGPSLDEAILARALEAPLARRGARFYATVGDLAHDIASEYDRLMKEPR